MDGSDGAEPRTAADVGAELRRIRTERGLSLKQFGELVNYSLGYLSKLENGHKPITSHIAAAFDKALHTDGSLAKMVARPTTDDDVAVCPFPGLAAFDQERAEWFFGRERVIAELLSILADRLHAVGPRYPLVVYGASGAGKSSLLRAGMRAALRAGRLPGSPDRPHVVCTPTADPVQAFATALATETDRDDTARCPVVVVDQFEEMFTLCPDRRMRQEFVNALCAASTGADGRPSALVVIGVRADFWQQCMGYPELLPALQHGVPLGAMSDTELRDVIEKPAAAVGLGLEPGLVEVMLGELRQIDESTGGSGYQSGTLPLLAHALLATWQQRDRETATLTLAGYGLTGGIEGAIAKTANKAYGLLDPGGQRVARDVLVRMIELGEGNRATRRKVELDELLAVSADPDTTRAVLDTLATARLITVHRTTVEIIHESLLTAWPELREWLDADREGLHLEQRLVQAARAWDRERRHEAGLYRGPRLRAAQERVDKVDPLIPEVARDFLDASIERELAEQQAIERRNRRLQRLNSRLRRSVAALSAVAVLAGIATVLAVIARNDVLAQRDAGVSREAAAAAVALRVSDPRLAGQLALAALKIEDTAEARGALMSAAVRLDPVRRTNADASDAVRTVAFNADATLLAAASQDRTARVWSVGRDPGLGNPPIAYLDHPGQVRSAMFDPRGRWLATSGGDHTLRLWAVDGLGKRGPVFQGPAHGGPLAVSGDGALLATGGSSETTFRLWDTTGPEPRQLPEVARHRDDVLAVAFAPGDKVLATASADGTIVVWDVANPVSPREMSQLDPAGGQVLSVSFSPDGTLLASGHRDSAARMWDVTDASAPRALPILPGALGPVADVEFSPDSRTLATASHDTTARLWDVSDPEHAVLRATPLAGDADNMYSVAFSPDNHSLATASHGLTVHLWETDIQRATEEICAVAQPTITPEQWDRLLPDHAYQPPCEATEPALAGRTVSEGTVELPVGTTTLMASHSGKCVTIKEGATASGAPAVQLNCDRGPGAIWTLRAEGDEVYRIRNESSDLCLDSSDDERKNGGATQVVQRPCTAADGQLWSIKVMARGADWADVTFNLTGQEIPDDCLNINGVSREDDAHVVRWPCGTAPGANAVFRISSAALNR